jgi:hypothetical protein
LKDQKQMTLIFSATDNMPDLSALHLTKAEDLKIPGGYGIGPPAVARRQGNETALYFYYRANDAKSQTPEA